MGTRIETIDQELKKLAEVLQRILPLMQQELLTYRVLQTQHDELRARNESLVRQCVESEEKIKQAVAMADAITGQARSEAQEVRASMATAQAKFAVKYKELEKSLEEADRKHIRKSLKELEEVAA